MNEGGLCRGPRLFGNKLPVLDDDDDDDDGDDNMLHVIYRSTKSAKTMTLAIKSYRFSKRSLSTTMIYSHKQPCRREFHESQPSLSNELTIQYANLLEIFLHFLLL